MAAVTESPDLAQPAGAQGMGAGLEVERGGMRAVGIGHRHRAPELGYQGRLDGVPCAGTGTRRHCKVAQAPLGNDWIWVTIGSTGVNYSDLQRALNGFSQKVLTAQLHDWAQRAAAEQGNL